MAKREGPKLKAALTRAKRKGPEAVLAEVARAEARWEVWGAAPDNHWLWAAAADDARLAIKRKGGSW